MDRVEELDTYIHKIIRLFHSGVNPNICKNELCISPQEGKILMSIYFLRVKGENVTASSLSQQYGITIPAIMHKLTILENKGYIFRKEDKLDKRIKYIKLSDDVYHHCESIHTKKRKDLNDFLEYLGEEDSNNLISIIKKITNYIEINKGE